MTRKTIFKRLTAAQWLAIALLLAACDSSDPFAGCGNQCTHAWDGTPGSCKNNDSFGANGGPCDFVVLEGEVCNDPLATCVDHVCVPCGSTNEACCQNGLGNGAPESCNGGETCTKSTDFDTCQVCGVPGEKCCGGGGPKCQQGVCNLDSDMCEVGVSDGSGAGSGSGSGAADPCQGPNSYSVAALDLAGCVLANQTLMSTTLMQAQACAAELQAKFGWPKISAINAVPIDEFICETSFLIWGSTLEYQVVDSSAATSCAMELCGVDAQEPQFGCTYASGLCPGDN